MIGLATALLIYVLASKLWTVLDPDSAEVRFNSGFREVVAVAGQIAVVVLCAMVVGLTGGLLIGYIGAFVVLDALAYLATR